LTDDIVAIATGVYKIRLNK